MNLEQNINYQLNKCPRIKRIVKCCYQRLMYALSKEIISEGNIKRISPNDNLEHFFGYYDKSPWDASDRYMLCIAAKDTCTFPDPLDEADIILIDTQEENKTRRLASTHTWNVQQGCMAQWLGPDHYSKIVYNDLRKGNYCSVVLDISTMEERVLPIPIYTISEDGKTALSLDFSRLHNLRPGYGYAAIPENTKEVALPDETCIWRMDIESGEVVPLLKYTDFASFQPRPEMLKTTTVHKVNHMMISPNGKRFMVLYRWFCDHRKYTRLITCNIDGSDMYLLSDDDMVSHCCWKNNEEILAFERKEKGGLGYYLMKDKTKEYTHLWPQLCNDGHPSYCPSDNSLVVFDTYPDRARVQEVKLAYDSNVSGENIKVIARVFSPFKYDNDTRCDLHPRWSRDGKKVCIDSVFEGHRELYVISLEDE